MIKKIAEYIPVLTILVTVIGIVKLNIYYSGFSVPIKYYIGFSEITSVIADDLLFFVLICSSLFFSFIILKEMNLHKRLNESSRRWLSISIYTFNVLALSVLIIWLFFEKEYYLKVIIQCSIGTLVFGTFLNTRFMKNVRAQYASLSYVFFVFVLCLINALQSAAKEIRSIKKGEYTGTKIITKDTTYVSTSACYYVGQTEKYLFLYDTSKHSIILPMSEVLKIELCITD